MGKNLNFGPNMDFFEKSGVNIFTSVVVLGVTHTDKDNEIFDFLKQYGRFKKIMVDDETCPYYKNLIIEYRNESAVAELKKIMPYTHISETNPEIKYRVMMPEIKGTASAEFDESQILSPTNYMNELKHIARRSGQKFEVVLQEMLSQINDHLTNVEVEPPSGNGEQEDTLTQTVGAALSLPGQQGAAAGATAQPQLQSASSSSLDHQRSLPPPRHSLSNADINPPEIQRVIVEHIVKADELTSHSMPTLRLRPFSGKTPKPTNENDYDTWRSHIELLLADVNLPPVQVTRKILESLLSPAADVVKGLKPDTLPAVYLQILDSAYSTVQDGEELFAQFLNTLQDPGEKPSTYLQRLLLTINTVVKRGGVTASDIDKHLLRQFCRGCWDNSIITKLQLEQKKDNPPPFAELLLQLRTEEDRQMAKENLMKKHMGSSKQRAALHAQSCSCGHTDSGLSSIDELKQQVKKLQQQMTTLLAQTTRTSAKTANRNKPPAFQPQRAQATRPRAGFCYKCGEDGHISASCTQPANPALVQQKRTSLQQRQQQWDVNNNQKQSN